MVSTDCCHKKKAAWIVNMCTRKLQDLSCTDFQSCRKACQVAVARMDASSSWKVKFRFLETVGSNQTVGMAMHA